MLFMLLKDIQLPYHGVVADIGGGLGGLAQNGILERSETNQLWSVGRGACRFVLEGARESAATGRGCGLCVRVVVA